MTKTAVVEPGSWTVRWPRAGEPLYAAALQEALNWPPLASAEQAHERLVEFHSDARRRSLRIEAFAATEMNGPLITAAVSVESPGHGAVLIVPESAESPAGAMAMENLFRAAQAAWRQHGVRLGQLLLPMRAARTAEAAATSGFRILTRLVYLERGPGRAAPRGDRLPEVDWIAYSQEREPLFAATIESTYVDSMDCPELTGIRPMGDVLLGHKAAGDFDPRLWWLAARDNQPVGVLLLAGLPRHRAFELVYMGVVPEARSTGVGGALLARACSIADEASSALTLAVDERNRAARRLYRKWNFVRFAARDAWIVTLDRTEGCALNCVGA